MKIIQSTNKNALMTAVLSFLFGTIFLMLFLITQSDLLIRIGILYVTIALTLNTIMFIGLLINSIINYQYYRENLITISLFLLNIPITLLYILIVESNPFKNIF